jgi:regulatory protein
VTITTAGGRSFTIPEEQARVLSVGLELSPPEIDRLDRLDQYFRGRDRALRMVSLRARTRAEVRTALSTIGLSAGVRDGILAELEELGLVDDERFAREFVRTKAEVRFFGPHRLRRDLAKKGVAREIIDTVLDEELAAESQEAQARALVERKLAGAPVDERAVRRIAGLLQRKGYDYEIVNRISYELLRRAGSDEAREDQ